MYYLYSKKTYEFLTESKDCINNLIVGCTDQKPPKVIEPYKSVTYSPQLQRWIIVDDYRGKWWNKQTKEVKVITQLGETIDLNQWTQKEPCDFCIWDNYKQDWVFSLDLYKEYAIQKLYESYQRYLLSKENVLRMIGFNSMVVRAILLINTNKSLTNDQLEKIAEYISQADEISAWITQVMSYEVELEAKIKSCETKDCVDKVLESVDFSKFDESHPNVSIADKLAYISSLQLTEVNK